MDYFATFLAAAIVLFILYLFIYKPLEETNKRMKKSLDFYRETYLQEQGSTTMFGDKGFDNPVLNYDLRSWDAGKNWYAVDHDFVTEQVKVLGDVETIHPGLFEHLESWRKLIDHVNKNGPLNPTLSKDLKVMEDAGFTVKEN
jgi:hypothetical protein